jgi:hypothetical protein
MKKKIITLSLSRTKATDLLKGSLREVSSSAFKALDETACYGNVHEREGETTFVIGLGPTGLITAEGNITDFGPEQSQLTYKFKGLPWAFLKKSLLNIHFKKAFESYIINPNNK